MNRLEWKQYWREQRLSKKEEWKDIEGYEGLYEISSFGNVKSLNYRRTWKEENIKPSKCNGYCHILLHKNTIKKTKKIHRLVSIAFIQNVYNKLEVNHINWIKTDNRVENLEWCTRSENNKHAWDTWLNKVSESNNFKTNNPRPTKWKFWKDNPNSKPVNQYTKGWELIREWLSVVDIKRELWINYWNISSCLRWRYKSAGWFLFKYNNARNLFK